MFCFNPYLLLLYSHYLSFGRMIGVALILMKRFDWNMLLKCLEVNEAWIQKCVTLPLVQKSYLFSEKCFFYGTVGNYNPRIMEYAGLLMNLIHFVVGTGSYFRLICLFLVTLEILRTLFVFVSIIQLMCHNYLAKLL